MWASPKRSAVDPSWHHEIRTMTREGDDGNLAAANVTAPPLEQMINWGQVEIDTAR